MVDPIQLSSVGTFFSQLISRSIEIVEAPKSNPEAIWLLAPLMVTIILMEFYFGRYSKEELGWNTAFGNSLVLIFIAAFLFKYIHENNLRLDSTKMAVMAILISVGLILTIVDYLHLIPKKLAFTISSKLPLNYLAYAVIVLVYTDIPVEALTILSFIVLFIAFSIFVWFIHVMAPQIKDTIFPGSVPEPSPESPQYKEST